jgi:SPP1 family predicted phage head-tail adaptor
MLFNTVITLLSRNTSDTNEYGDNITTVTETEVYADELEIGQNEFYQAKTAGLKPQYRFRVRREEYNNEERAKYNGKTYNIIRTYRIGPDMIELVLGGIVGTEVK